MASMPRPRVHPGIGPASQGPMTETKNLPTLDLSSGHGRMPSPLCHNSLQVARTRHESPGFARNGRPHEPNAVCSTASGRSYPPAHANDAYNPNVGELRLTTAVRKARALALILGAALWASCSRPPLPPTARRESEEPTPEMSTTASPATATSAADGSGAAPSATASADSEVPRASAPWHEGYGSCEAPDTAEDSAPAGFEDKEATRLGNQAIMVEYLGTQFEKAAETLKEALDLCTSHQGACSPKLVAKLHRDLGVVLITGLGALHEGQLEFECAKRLDPTVHVDPDLQPGRRGGKWQHHWDSRPARF